jgi:diguanylate cyclase (GGDEF)-like protein
MDKRKVLIVDDDPQISQLMTAVLQTEGLYDLKVADSGESALEAIEEWRPDLVLLDVNMPGISGLEILSLVRRREAHVGVILVSGNSETEDVIKGLDSGADDYICKPFNPYELMARVRTQLRIKSLTDDLSAANKKLKTLVEIDDLTGLYNMRSMYQRIELELSRCLRLKTGLCIVMMDMDHFKRVNDDHDHLFGSFVLQHVGKIIKENVRDVDYGARYGGDEFMVVLSSTDYKGAEVFCERVRSKIENYKFDNGDHQIDLTSSIGFAVYFPGEAGVEKLTSQEVLKWADKALYECKEKGRNRTEGININEELKTEKKAA